MKEKGHPARYLVCRDPFYERILSANLRRHLKMIFVEPRGNRSDVGDVASLTLDRIVDDLENQRAEPNLGRFALLRI